ncbi:hypothetical protein [Parapedobacter koreensis]|uniref:Short chain amide porin n=1 Tax=Parapedobacter koreensis TaxID=332977 RepID=A0A1H7FM73_9SPHI|nr:hypothetical protein [Parapedobacter koreensis]SEK26337.1 hypothetical protein SAMN05421740_101378 [Parapedobacter koreensis]
MKSYIQRAKWMAFALVLLFNASVSHGQAYKDGKFWLNDDGSHYFKLTLLSQVWLRSTDLNPGSTINGYAKDHYTDIGIRRARVQAYGQLTDRVFIYTQVGMNNFNFLSDRKAGFFIHDILGEYAAVKGRLSFGMGLTAWNGLTRFAAPSVATILGVDAPLFEQTTNDVTDQFLRKLSLYAKGKLGRLDYRLVMSSPMDVHKAAGYSDAISTRSNFSPLPAKMQWQGYFKWDFLDKEDNTTPYSAGSYYGTKKVFNVGVGFQFQPDAMWHAGATGDTVLTDMKHVAVDAFYDVPLQGAGGPSISAYATYIHFDHGPGYIRQQAVMNPANGTTMAGNAFSGGGNGYPSFGTGDLVYAQVGYKFKENLIGSTTLMPYASAQFANYDRLNDNMLFWDAGINWLLKGTTSKLTLAYQNRPVYETAANGNGERSGHKGTALLQYQVFF